MAAVTLSSNHSGWASAFNAELLLLQQSIGNRVLSIEHVGSTAVPGLPAKPVLDLLVTVESFEAAHPLVPSLTKLGYEYRGEHGIPDRHYFVKGEPRTHHLHMLASSHPGCATMLDFRNLLRFEPAIRAQYAQAKQQFAAAASDKTDYQSAKDRVVEALLDRMLRPNKVCPLVTRRRASLELLAFHHPIAGAQLVKGTVEPGESLRAAALRELEEESGIQDARITADLGWWRSQHLDQVWAFHLCDPRGELPDAWTHHALEDSGLDFRFFWQPLEAPVDHFHPVHAAAIRYVRSLLGGLS